MDKNIWGPYMWNTMHFVALGYPKEATDIDKKNYKSFYYNLVNIIPCQECSTHLSQNFKSMPIDNYLNSREKLFEWTILLHNSVNKMLGKEEWSLNKANKYYKNTSFNITEQIKCFNKSYILIIILLIFLILLFFTKDILKKQLCKLKIM